MGFVKHTGSKTKYQGTSFTRSIEATTKDENNVVSSRAWEDNEVGNYEMTDKDGNVVSSGDLMKSADKLSLTFTVPDSTTTSFLGKYLIIAYLTDTADEDINEEIAEYNMTYLDKKAR